MPNITEQYACDSCEHRTPTKVGTAFGIVDDAKCAHPALMEIKGVRGIKLCRAQTCKYFEPRNEAAPRMSVDIGGKDETAVSLFRKTVYVRHFCRWASEALGGVWTPEQIYFQINGDDFVRDDDFFFDWVSYAGYGSNEVFGTRPFDSDRWRGKAHGFILFLNQQRLERLAAQTAKQCG